MIRHITFSDENMTVSAIRCQETAYSTGKCDYSIFLDPNDYLGNELFCNKNKSILAQSKGCGYWLWKPYLILTFLEQMQEGNYLIYTDAGIEFVNSVQPLIESMDESCLLFQNNWKHADWCKGDVYKLTPGYEGKQLQASAMIFKVCQESIDFVREWLTLCETPGLIDDSPSITPNQPGFQEHRHDQAILTALQVQKGIKAHWWPAMYNGGQFVYDKGDHKDIYPVIFHHHRKRNNEW